MASFIFGSLLGLATMGAESITSGIASAVSGGLMFEGGESILKKGYQFIDDELKILNNPSPLQNNNKIYTPQQKRDILVDMLKNKSK